MGAVPLAVLCEKIIYEILLEGRRPRAQRIGNVTLKIISELPDNSIQLHPPLQSGLFTESRNGLLILFRYHQILLMKIVPV